MTAPKIKDPDILIKKVAQGIVEGGEGKRTSIKYRAVAPKAPPSPIISNNFTLSLCHFNLSLPIRDVEGIFTPYL